MSIALLDYRKQSRVGYQMEQEADCCRPKEGRDGYGAEIQGKRTRIILGTCF